MGSKPSKSLKFSLFIVKFNKLGFSAPLRFRVDDRMVVRVPRGAERSGAQMRTDQILPLQQMPPLKCNHFSIYASSSIALP